MLRECQALLLLVAAFPSANGSDYMLGQQVRERIREFLQMTYAAKDDLSLPKTIDTGVPMLVNGVHMLEIKSQDWVAKVNGETGNLHRFSIKGVPYEEQERSRALTHADAITKEQAFRAFIPLAERLALPVTEKEYIIRFEDIGEFDVRNLSVERDLYACQYSITQDFRYNGLPCRDYGRDRGILVDVSASSGRITSVIYKPVVVPEEKPRTFENEKANEITAAWLAEQSYFSDSQHRKARLREPALEDNQLVVACPNNYPNQPLTMEEQFTAKESRYCWEVLFEYLEVGHWFAARAWVDANSGVVIGGRSDSRQ